MGIVDWVYPIMPRLALAVVPFSFVTFGLDRVPPFPIVLLGSGLITMVLGTVVGLPALRLSGLYLALITLMLASNAFARSMAVSRARPAAGPPS